MAYALALLALVFSTPVPLEPGTWWQYREYYTERIGALDSTTEALTRFSVYRSGGGLFLHQRGGADPSSGPIELGEGWIRLGSWTGEEALPLPLEPGRSGPPLDEGLAGWTVEAAEEVSVPGGVFSSFRCALRTRASESVLWIAPGIGVVRETHGAPGRRPEIERVLVTWSGATSKPRSGPSDRRSE